MRATPLIAAGVVALSLGCGEGGGGPPRTGADARIHDAGSRDGTVDPDAAGADAGPMADTSVADAARRDAGLPDAAPPSDGGAADANDTDMGSGGGLRLGAVRLVWTGGPTGSGPLVGGATSETSTLRLEGRFRWLRRASGGEGGGDP